MEKFLEYLDEAEKRIKTADHLLYTTYTLVKDKKVLFKILEETKKAIANCINSILQFEYLYKRIGLSSNPKENLRKFIEKCAQRYYLSEEELTSIIELFKIIETHKQSSMEFSKQEKLIILSEDFKKKTISVEEIKNFVKVGKSILRKAKFKIYR